MLKITVEMKRSAHSYEILFEPGLTANWRAEVAERVPADGYIVLADANYADLAGLPQTGAVEGRWRYLRVEPGERRKDLGQYVCLCERIVHLGLDRGWVVVAVGGGVTGDIAGFIASTLMRGVRLVQIPTTLLAQVDSSVGGKNGVNTSAGKNLIGTFFQPELVLIDPMALDTLPEREYLAGLAEVAKIGILDGPEFFQQLREGTEALLARNHGFLAGVIARCCRYKSGLVASDERDRGLRQLLNLGHTFGHGLEALAGYDGRVVHGEAVAAGLALAAEFSSGMGYLPSDESAEIRKLLRGLGLPTAIAQLGAASAEPPVWRELLRRDDFPAILAADKKAGGGRLTLVLPHAIGDCRIERGHTAVEVADFMRSRVNG